MQRRSFTSEDLTTVRKDGSVYHVHTSIFPVFKNKSFLFYVQFLYDITERKNIEKIKLVFLSSIAHELKTPITTLKLMTQVHMHRLNKLYPDNFSILNETKLLNQELDRLTTLINDLLDLSQIETGKLSIKPEVIDLGQIITNTIYKFLLSFKYFQIKYEGLSQLFVLADPIRIEQVITNLLSNAIKYSRDKKEIVVFSKILGKKVIVGVKDYGYGIARSEQRNIFDLFYQINSTKSGFGLGLFICKQIIKNHHETIWVKSEEGKGSTFFFSLSIKKI